MDEHIEGNDVQEEVDQHKLEESIIAIIAKIKKDRNRACIQNIHTFINRRGIDIEMDEVKKVIDNLILRNIVIDKGKEGKESFFIVDLPPDGEDISFNLKHGDDDESSFNALQHFIDEKFHSVLVNKIKTEIQIALKDALNCDIIQAINDSNNNKETNVNGNKCLNELIAVLKDEIKFLRNELDSKNTIIQIMTNDKFNECADKKENVVVTSSESNEESKIVAESNVNNVEKMRDGDITEQNLNVINDDVKRGKNRSVVILGDSMLKDIEQHKVRNGLANNEKVFVKHFSGATVKDMKSYVIPTKSFENDLIILHCGTNDLRSIKKPSDIANEIINLALDLKTEKNDLMISGIVPRRDKFNGKGMEVNKYLISQCNVNNIHYIDNKNLNTTSDLNMSGLHLNKKGIYVLGGNLVNAIML